MHACEKPLKEDNIEKILGEKLVEEPFIDVPVLDTSMDNILNGKDTESEDSNDE